MQRERMCALCLIFTFVSATVSARVFGALWRSCKVLCHRVASCDSPGENPCCGWKHINVLLLSNGIAIAELLEFEFLATTFNL
jgi:hypothetical protein